MIDKWKRDGITRLHAEGKSQRQISAALGVSIQTVNTHIKKIKRGEKKGAAPVVAGWGIDLSKCPTVETVKTDILTVYRRSLYELNERLPSMTDEQVYQLSMTLLNQIKSDGDVEN